MQLGATDKYWSRMLTICNGDVGNDPAFQTQRRPLPVGEGAPPFELLRGVPLGVL